jgi:SUMO ligase MMS21 Smc5/6 complex component
LILSKEKVKIKKSKIRKIAHIIYKLLRISLKAKRKEENNNRRVKILHLKKNLRKKKICFILRNSLTKGNKN